MELEDGSDAKVVEEIGTCPNGGQGYTGFRATEAVVPVKKMLEKIDGIEKWHFRQLAMFNGICALGVLELQTATDRFCHKNYTKFTTTAMPSII